MLAKRIKDSDYFIREDGLVWSSLNNKFLTGYKASTGYINIDLKRAGIRTTIHRLLAEAFIDNPYNKQTVNHIDGVRDNNNLKNLEWATYSENNKHSWDVLAYGRHEQTSQQTTGEGNPSAKLTEADVLKIREEYKPGKGVTSFYKDKANEYGISWGTVKNICLRRSWRHI